MMRRDNEGNRSVDGGSAPTSGLLAPTATGSAEPLTPVPDEAAYRRGRSMVTGRVDENAPLPRFFLALVGVITVGGLLFRLPSFNDSLAGDEISTYFIVVGHSLGRVLRLVHSNQETTPPLYFIVAWATKGVLGSPSQSIRLVSLVTGTAAIPLTFLLGLWTVGRRTALVGATCVALSPFMIFYSTEARPYMLVVFLALLSTLSLLRALDTGRPGWWVAYGVCTCGAAYTHYTVVFLLITQLAWALWTQPQARRALIIANLAAGLAYLPWLTGLREDLHAPNLIGTLAPVNLHTLGRILPNFWIGHPIIPIGQLPGNLAVVLAAAGLAIGVLGLALGAMQTSGWTWRLPPRTALIVLLAIAPAVLIILYSWARADILGGMSQIASWPALALAIGALVTSPPRPLRLAAVALTLGAYAIGGAKMLGSGAQRPNINAAVAYIDRAGTNGDPIVSEPYFTNPLSELDVALANAGQSERHPVIRLGSPLLSEQLRYLSGPHPQPVFFGLPVRPPSAVASQAVALARHGTIFLVTSVVSFSASSTNNSNVTLREFIQALPAGFSVVERIAYPSFPGSPAQSLYVIRDGPTIP